MSEIATVIGATIDRFGATALGWVGFALLLWANVLLSRALIRNYSASIEAAAATARALTLVVEKIERLMERHNA